MTNDECRAEALKRVEESDRLLEEYLAGSRVNNTDPILYNRISHLRQTAVVYAALAGPSHGA